MFRPWRMPASVGRFFRRTCRRLLSYSSFCLVKMIVLVGQFTFVCCLPLMRLPLDITRGRKISINSPISCGVWSRKKAMLRIGGVMLGAVKFSAIISSLQSPGDLGTNSSLSCDGFQERENRTTCSGDLCRRISWGLPHYGVVSQIQWSERKSPLPRQNKKTSTCFLSLEIVFVPDLPKPTVSITKWSAAKTKYLAWMIPGHSGEANGYKISSD